MKKIYLLLLVIFIAFTACESSNRATQQRRGLMMPKLSEVPVNKRHFKERTTHTNTKVVKKIQKTKKRR